MPHTKVVSKTEYEVLAEFRYTPRRFMSFSEDAAEEIGLTPNSIKPAGYQGISMV